MCKRLNWEARIGSGSRGLKYEEDTGGGGCRRRRVQEEDWAVDTSNRVD